MKKIETYIINLPKSTERRAYMEELTSSYDYMDVRFFDAVYGKALSEEELNARFDRSLAYKRYGRELEPGEIGCSLSHYELYRQLAESDSNFYLILEDDITILKDITSLPLLTPCIDCDEPRVLLLSGDYWYWKTMPVSDNISIASVFDAVGTYAYFINKAAARRILAKNPVCAYTADNWALFRQQGVKLKATYPYLIDANIEEFESEIKQSHFGHIRTNMPLGIKLMSYWVALVKRLIIKRGHFVAKIRTPRCRQSQS